MHCKIDRLPISSLNLRKFVFKSCTYQRAAGVARGRAHACECAGLIFSYYFLNIKNHICCYVVVIYIVKVFLMTLGNILNDENILECLEYCRLLKYSVTEVRKVGLN